MVIPSFVIEDDKAWPSQRPATRQPSNTRWLFWHGSGRFAIVQGTTSTTWELQVPALEMLACLDALYWGCVYEPADDRHSRLTLYFERLRIKAETELALTDSCTFASLRPWATREKYGFGHSRTGRSSYLLQCVSNSSPWYEEDPFGFGTRPPLLFSLYFSHMHLADWHAIFRAYSRVLQSGLQIAHNLTEQLCVADQKLPSNIPSGPVSPMSFLSGPMPTSTRTDPLPFSIPLINEKNLELEALNEDRIRERASLVSNHNT
jgi:hypothetical protein